MCVCYIYIKETLLTNNIDQTPFWYMHACMYVCVYRMHIFTYPVNYMPIFNNRTTASKPQAGEAATHLAHAWGWDTRGRWHRSKACSHTTWPLLYAHVSHICISHVSHMYLMNLDKSSLQNPANVSTWDPNNVAQHQTRLATPCAPQACRTAWQHVFFPVTLQIWGTRTAHAIGCHRLDLWKCCTTHGFQQPRQRRWTCYNMLKQLMNFINFKSFLIPCQSLQSLQSIQSIGESFQTSGFLRTIHFVARKELTSWRTAMRMTWK